MGLDSIRAVVPQLVLLPIYPFGSLVLDMRMLGIGSPEQVELTLDFLPRVDCVLTLDPTASYFVELGRALGHPLGCSDPSMPVYSFERLLSCLYCLLLPVTTCSCLSCLYDYIIFLLVGSIMRMHCHYCEIFTCCFCCTIYYLHC